MNPFKYFIDFLNKQEKLLVLGAFLMGAGVGGLVVLYTVVSLFCKV